MRITSILLTGLLASAIAASAQAAVIPPQFQGKWAGSLQTCSNPGDGRFEVYADRIRWYESKSTVLAVRVISPLEVEVDLESTGEGETWKHTLKLLLSEDKRTITNITHKSPEYHSSRVRCD